MACGSAIVIPDQEWLHHELLVYPFEIVQLSCGECLRNGKYTKPALIEKYIGQIPPTDLPLHIVDSYESWFYQTRVDTPTGSYPRFMDACLVLFMAQK